MNQVKARNGSIFRIVGLIGLIGILAGTFAENAAAATQPPRPPGSSKVNVAPGQSPEESQRMQRAHEHHDASSTKKDYTWDETTEERSTLVPPPLPSFIVTIHIQPGQSPQENAGMLRAHEHHHALHNKKDFDKDDLTLTLTDDDSGATAKKPATPSAR